jgi:predicted transposase/invertase (TIGR01784 family)
MNIAEGLKQIGREEGLQLGIERGRSEGLEEGIEKGLKKGRYEAFLETARKLLVRGIEPEIVLETTGLTRSELKRLFH